MYPSSVELPPLLLWLELLLEPLYPVESWYSSIAFFVPSLDEETDIFLAILKENLKTRKERIPGFKTKEGYECGATSTRGSRREVSGRKILEM